MTGTSTDPNSIRHGGGGRPPGLGRVRLGLIRSGLSLAARLIGLAGERAAAAELQSPRVEALLAEAVDRLRRARRILNERARRRWSGDRRCS